MESWVLWIIMIFGICHQESNAKTHFKYLTNYCSETVEVTASLILVLTPSEILKTDRGPDYFHCSVDLMAAKGTRLHVHLLHLSISSEEKHTDRLKLFDVIPGRPRIPITPAQGLYGMLDRSLMTSDKAGSTVEDFRSAGRWMQVEYLGKPTQTHSGFRMLVTTTADKDDAGKCPQTMYACQVQNWCIPTILACNRYPNCGIQDNTDEINCDLSNLVVSVSYSLPKDILLIGCLPVFIFILVVVIVSVTTRWHVTKRYPPELPSVKYTHTGDGHVALGDATEDEPPSYTEAIANAAKPPAYNTLEALERDGVVKLESDEDDWQHSGHPFRERRSRDILTTSTSSIEQMDERRVVSQRQKRVHRPIIPLDMDCSEDEKAVKKGGRKGGKSKCKNKRRADDLCPPSSSNVTTPETLTVCTSLPHSTPSTSPLVSPSSPSSSSPSNPSVENAMTPSSSAVSSFSSTSCSLQAPSSKNKRDKSSNVIPTLPASQNLQADNSGPNTSHSSIPPVAILPLSNSSCVEVAKSNRGSHHFHPDGLHSDLSSGPEADRKSETESMTLGRSSGKTESCASLSETPPNSTSSVSASDSRPDEFVKDFNGERSIDKGKRNGASKNVKRHGKVPKTGEKRKQNGAYKVKPELIPFDRKAPDVEDSDDDDNNDERELCEDADVSSESDAGVEVDLRKQEVVSLGKKKKKSSIV